MRQAMALQKFTRIVKDSFIFAVFAYFMPVIALWVLTTKGPAAAQAVVRKAFNGR